MGTRQVGFFLLHLVPSALLPHSMSILCVVSTMLAFIDNSMTVDMVHNECVFCRDNHISASGQ